MERGLALDRRASLVGGLLRAEDRHVRGIGEDLQAVGDDANRLAAHDGTEQVPRGEPAGAHRPALRAGGLLRGESLDADGLQRRLDELEQVVVIGSRVA